MCIKYHARSDNQTVAQLVGCHHAKVGLLVKAGLLDCLNGDVPGAVKYYATIDVLERSAEPKWQVHATKVLAGQDIEPAELRGQFRKPRARGLQESPDTSTGLSLTREAVRKEFLEALKTNPDGTTISALLRDPDLARILGFRLHDLAPLRGLGLLKADNQDLRSAKKLHSREYILGLALDISWLADATRAINAYWRAKNGRKGSGRA